MRVDEFQDFLNKDLAWRKMEISQLFGILSTAESKAVVCKSMILLLYAHWEGFIKKSSKCYLKYVSDSSELGCFLKARSGLYHEFDARSAHKYDIISN